jgi:hypothetical protein
MEEASSSNEKATTLPQQRLLCFFNHRLLDYRRQEVEALAAMAGCRPEQVTWEPPFGGDLASPYHYVTLPSVGVAKEICERAVLVKVRLRCVVCRGGGV